MKQADQNLDVTIELFDYSYDSMRIPLADFLESVSDAFESVPPEYRGTAIFECDHGYGDTGATFKASYTRPETDGELAAREARDAKYRAECEARERALFQELSRKYAGQT